MRPMRVCWLRSKSPARNGSSGSSTKRSGWLPCSPPESTRLHGPHVPQGSSGPRAQRHPMANHLAARYLPIPARPSNRIACGSRPVRAARHRPWMAAACADGLETCTLHLAPDTRRDLVLAAARIEQESALRPGGVAPVGLRHAPVEVGLLGLEAVAPPAPRARILGLDVEDERQVGRGLAGPFLEQGEDPPLAHAERGALVRDGR